MKVKSLLGCENTYLDAEKCEIEKHLRKTKRQLYRGLVRAYWGWWLWSCICRTKGFGNTAVVLIPGDDQEISHIALLYLDQLLEKRKYDNAVILTHDNTLTKAAGLFSKRILKIKKFDRKKAEALMQYYSLFEFNPRFICASLDEPYGRNGSAMIGKHGTTKEEVFVMGVYRLYPIIRPKKIIYDGDDKDIIDFCSIYERFGD